MARELCSTKKRTGSDCGLPRPVAPFNSNPSCAAEQCFDRSTGERVPVNRLKTYTEALSSYHLHPEAKFLNGDYVDRGRTVRRHIHVAGVRYIGKEANRWEEQFYLGYDPETQTEYGMDEQGRAEFRARLCEAEKMYGQRNLAKTAGVAREQLRAILKAGAQPRPGTDGEAAAGDLGFGRSKA
jgi:hypothetical protein